MRRPLLLAAAAVATAALTGGAVPAASAASSSAPAHGHKRVCSATPKAGTASCHAEVRTKGGDVTPDATSTQTAGYTPAQLQKAYHVPTGGRGTIAIVDAYANPNAQTDLDAYRDHFTIPRTPLIQYRQDGTALTTANTPAPDAGWGQEESLDLDMASAICPTCSIMYVGANSSSFSDLMAAASTANAKGAAVISNSYGGSEFSGENNAAYLAPYNNDAVVTISSGDSGYGAQFPAALQGRNILAVGGTNLTLNTDSSRKTETVWSGAGSGCSALIAKPSWQHDSGCGRRTIADVSAVADPATGVAVYDSYGSTNGANWFVFGGTSVAAPIVGSYYAASGYTRTTGSAVTPHLYAAAANTTTSPLFDVTSGSNGRCRSNVAYLCTGRSGYDGPSGLGTPKAAPPTS